ncbi:Nif11-like leader peptide family natural product precursor [Cerasicoccus maritimus]|uniref:Nif11-like leader peptide family natural product precursor n=1 Tax=Cerasicoccus maritimus TaxID=490089 RepID=UPI0028524A11|nr:Nif11-like leader peptide family natural product precursor [Cerasicoccus maritimus]
MSKENVEKLLFAGGSDKNLRHKYNVIETKAEFVTEANKDGYDFTATELDDVLAEEELDFASSGNPRTRQIWLR